MQRLRAATRFFREEWLSDVQAALHLCSSSRGGIIACRGSGRTPSTWNSAYAALSANGYNFSYSGVSFQKVALESCARLSSAEPTSCSVIQATNAQLLWNLKVWNKFETWTCFSLPFHLMENVPSCKWKCFRSWQKRCGPGGYQEREERALECHWPIWETHVSESAWAYLLRAWDGMALSVGRRLCKANPIPLWSSQVPWEYF